MDPILYWNEVALEANRIAHTKAKGQQTGPTLSSRALAIVHLAMHDAYFGVDTAAGQGLYLPGATTLPSGGNAAAAVAAAACSTLAALHPSQLASFEKALGEAEIPDEDASTSRAYGLAVAKAILDKLAVKPGEPGADDGREQHPWRAELPDDLVGRQLVEADRAAGEGGAEEPERVGGWDGSQPEPDRQYDRDEQRDGEPEGTFDEHDCREYLPLVRRVEQGVEGAEGVRTVTVAGA